MCGLVGELRFEASRSSADWPRLIGAIARRGPDDDGMWSEEQHCTLGFTRLSILDLSDAAHQPLVSDDGSLVIVLNGEIYNYRELRHELTQRGRRFRSAGDAEVAMYAIAEWGTAALERFNGMFALALYSVRERSLLLGRDHAGIKPLYVLHDPRGCVFASQFDQLLAHPWSRERDISEIGRSLYLRLGYVPAPHSILRGAEMVPAGSWLQVRSDKTMVRGVHFEFPVAQEGDLSSQAACDAVDAAVSNAVRRQLVSDVPIGAFLSGGVDSPLVAANMCKASRDRLPAFTIGTEERESDESEDAARYALELGLSHYSRRIAETEVLSLVPELVRACAEPFADYSLFPSMVVSQLARERVKVVLSGDGGDELFWGYGHRFSSVLQIAEDFRQPQWLRDTRWGASKYLGLGSARLDIRRPSIGAWYRSRHSRIPEEMLGRILPSLGAWPEEFGSFDYRGWGRDETAQWMRWNEFTGHLAMVLLKVDRASMYHSLEVRVPLLDKEVIATAVRIDWRSCLDIEHSLGKLPLRSALRRHVSNPTIPKRGFSVPMDQWMRGPLRALLQERLFDRNELAGLPLSQPALRAWFEEHQSGSAAHGWGLWLLLSLALWEDEYWRGRR